MPIGNVLAAANELRRKHYRAGLRTLLLEAADTNRCPQSENLSLWAKSSGTGATIGGLADPLGGTSAYKLDDQDGAIDVNWKSTLVAYSGAFTSRGFSFYAKADTSAAADVGIRDETAAIYRLRITVTNTAGVITAAIQSGSGSIVAVIPSTDQPGWYRILVRADGLTIGNLHAIYLRPAGQTGTNVGAMLFWGLMAHERGYPAHSYIQNNTNSFVTCNNDDLRLPWLTPPGAMSFYAAYREIGAQGVAIAEAAGVRILQLDNGNNSLPRIILLHPNGKEFRIQYENLTTAQSTTTSGAPILAYGDLVEVVGWIYQNASGQIGVSINGGPLLLSAIGFPLAGGLPAAYDPLGLVANQQVRIGSSIGIGFGGEFKSYGLFPGIFTIDELRSQVALVS